MRSLTISFLATSILSLPVPSVLSQNFFPRPQIRQTPGCHYPQLSSGAYIHFTYPPERNNSFEYSIYTPWARYYPDTLRARLVEANFILRAPSSPNGTDACGWELVEEVKVGHWHRGDISFRYLPFLEHSQRKAAATPRSTSFPLPSYPSTQQTPLYPRQALAPRPSNETLGRVHNVVVSSYPNADIAMHIVEIVLPIVCAAGFMAIFVYIVRTLVQRYYAKASKKQHPYDIELFPVRVKPSQVPTSGPFFSSTEKLEGIKPNPYVWWKSAEAQEGKPRASSSVYSRSFDGTTLYYGDRNASWERVH